MKCCICHKETDGYDYSPFPIMRSKYAKCCEECYQKVVLPSKQLMFERIYEINEHKQLTLRSRD